MTKLVYLPRGRAPTYLYEDRSDPQMMFRCDPRSDPRTPNDAGPKCDPRSWVTLVLQVACAQLKLGIRGRCSSGDKDTTMIKISL